MLREIEKQLLLVEKNQRKLKQSLREIELKSNLYCDEEDLTTNPKYSKEQIKTKKNHEIILHEVKKNLLINDNLSTICNSNYKNFCTSFKNKLDNLEYQIHKKFCQKKSNISSCPICLENILENNKAILKCNHQICVCCFSKNIMHNNHTRNLCPLCREKIF